MNTIDGIRARLEKQRVVTPDDMEEVLDWLQIIQDVATPFRYALQQLADKDWHDDYTVFVDGALSDETGLSITAKQFYKLMAAIYGEFSGVHIPPYEDESEAL